MLNKLEILIFQFFLEIFEDERERERERERETCLIYGKDSISAYLGVCVKE